MSVYYVSPTGCDKTGDGSKEKPFATIGRADELKLLSAGDVVLVAAGEYDSVVHRFASGTIRRRITYRAYGVVRIAGEASFGTFEYPASYITLEGFVFAGGSVDFAGSPQGCAVENCVFELTGRKVCAAFNLGDRCVFAGNTVKADESLVALCSVCSPGRTAVRDNNVSGGTPGDIYFEYVGAEHNHFPNTEKHITLQGDFHIHTSEGSDGKVTTRDRFYEAKRNGIDVLALTDHGCDLANRDYIEEQRKYAGKLSEETGVIYIRGFETGLAYDPLNWREHLVAIGSDAYAKVCDHHLKDDGGEDDYFKRLKELKEQGAFIVWAHPDSDYPGIELADGFARTPFKKALDSGLIQGVEIVNGAVGYNPEGYWGDRYYFKGPRGASEFSRLMDYALDYNLTLFANNDAHESMVPCCTIMLAEEKSAEGAMEAIKAGRTAVYFEDILWGKSEVISELMDAMVSSERYPAIPNWKDYEKISFTNNSPMTLMPEIDGHVFALRPRESMRLYIEAGRKMRLLWTNIYIGTDKCFESEY